MITIQKSLTADSRTCDWTKVTKPALERSSRQHMDDVYTGLLFFEDLLGEAQVSHDNDKLTDIDGFHADFATGFQQQTWYENHKRATRHHLDKPEGVPKDVNLVDVIEHIVDFVMAGMARSGRVRPLELPDELLQRAFQNTVKLMKANVVVDDGKDEDHGCANHRSPGD